MGSTLRFHFFRLLADERGAAINEYALVAAFFAVASIATLEAISTNATLQLTTTQNNLMATAVTPP